MPAAQAGRRTRTAPAGMRASPTRAAMRIDGAALCQPVLRSRGLLLGGGELHEYILQAGRFGREIVQAPVALDSRAHQGVDRVLAILWQHAHEGVDALCARYTRKLGNRVDCRRVAQAHAQRLAAAEAAQRLDAVAEHDR